MGLNFDETCQTLRDWRGMSVRDSEQVVELGEKLLRDYSSRLQDELWLVCEQVYIAALDINRMDVANMCLEKLGEKFPKSSRVEKLSAMGLEAKCQFDEALKVYEKLSKSNETDASIKKRKISLLKSRGVTTDIIIQELTKYLQDFMSDHEAWMELSELYIKEMDYKKAAFCFEELILSNPFNHLYHQRYAEIVYSIGGTENLEIARRYFAQAVKLSSNTNMRALYGLLLTAGGLTSSKGENKGKSNKHYATWAAKMISSKYESVWPIGNQSSCNKSLSKITPSKDIPQLTASVIRMTNQLCLNDTST